MSLDSNIIFCDFRPWCAYCRKPMDYKLEGQTCSPECEEAVRNLEMRSLDEIMDDRLETPARQKFLRPINPDPIKAMAKELKRDS